MGTVIVRNQNDTYTITVNATGEQLMALLLCLGVGMIVVSIAMA
mgnify:CR=1 FL=1